MTAEAMVGTRLLKMDEDEFNKAINEMTVKDLMETISVLQKEMAKEQENFNSLSSELQNFKERNSRQYKQISKDMVVSQQRLTLLMNRSMKCFGQQNLHTSSNESPLKRRNSAKGINPILTSSSALTNLQRSKSLLAVNQTSSTDLSSPFQSPLKPYMADSGSSFQYSTNVSHMPIIMKTSTNGGIKKSLESASTNVIDKNKFHNVPKNAELSNKEKVSSLSTEYKGVPEGNVHGSEGSKAIVTDAIGHASNSSISGGAAGGLYVKRKPVQQQRVTTTTNISSSKFLPTNLLPSSPVSESPASPSFSITTNSAASSTHALSSRPIGTAPASSIGNETRFVKSKPVSSQSDYVSPLQMAQARKGVSKSQTFLNDMDSNTQGFRGLPSVKLLAQTFGSNTELNVIPGRSSNFGISKSNTFATTSTGVYKSNSTLNLSEPQSKTTSHISVSKGCSSGAAEQATQQAPSVFINGKSQTLPNRQLNRVTSSPAPPNLNNEPNELEKTRTRLRAVGRDLAAEATNGAAQPSNITSITSNAVTVLSANKQDNESINERQADNRKKIGAYLKRKDGAPGKTQGSNIESSSSPTVTIQSINSASSLLSSKMNSSASVGAQRNRISSSTLPPQSSGLDNLKSAPKPTVGASTTLTATKAQPTTQSFNSQQRQQISVTSTSKQNANMVFASLPLKEPGVRDPVVSTASVTIRRAKSREELQQIEDDTRTNKDFVLKQIMARRRDSDTDGHGSNIRTMSSLSHSMPSLLLEDSDDFHKGGDGSRSTPIKSSIILPPKTQNLLADSGTFIDDGIEVEDEDRVSRMNLRDWDPSPLLSELYQVKLMDEVAEDISHQFISMEGLMEKLPMNKRKATLLKTWKRRFFRAKDGWLYYYETSSRDQPSESIQLMGGTIHDIGTRVLGIDDGRGRYLMVRCPTEKEYGQWKLALESQTADNTKATYVRPVMRSPRHPNKNVIIIDLGSSAIRAGILGQQVSLPELFFPSLVAVSKDSGKVVAVGKDALRPEVRKTCKIIHPIRPSNKVDQFNIEVHLMKPVFEKIFQDLKVNSPDFWAMISTPQNLGDHLKKGLMQILVDTLKVKGVCMVQQALLSLYSYNATSGIIVDIGHRIEILPIFDGFVIEGGVARCPYGAQKVQESLTTSLLSNNYKFISTTEQLLVRYVMEKVCYVAQDYSLEVEWCSSQPQTIRKYVSLTNFDLPDGAYTNIECDLGRFKSPEGFFNVDMWEMDYPTLHKLVFQAIQTCPMDNRRHVWRAVFLSGGVTLLPGFAERLEKELSKLAPPGVPVEVHAAPQRYHAAFIGACSVALMPQFEGMAISKEEWKRDGIKAFKKWQAPATCS